VFTYKTLYSQDRSNHIRDNPLRAPERFFQAEEPHLSLEADFPPGAVQVGAFLLAEEIIRPAITGKMNVMPLLLHKMTKVETP
jgi:hypothetical protein